MYLLIHVAINQNVLVVGVEVVLVDAGQMLSIMVHLLVLRVV